MPPRDPSPLGDEMVRTLPERKFPEPKPGDQPVADEAAPDTAPDISHRPALPEHPQPMAADVEDEEADPVIDTGPGIADGVRSLNKQKG